MKKRTKQFNLNIAPHIRPSKSITSLNKSEEKYVSYNVNRSRKFDKLGLKSKKNIDKKQSPRIDSNEHLKINDFLILKTRSEQKLKPLNFLNLKTRDIDILNSEGRLSKLLIYLN